MTLLDMAIAAIVLFGLWRGFLAGAMKTALSLASWLIALVAASRLASSVAPLFVGATDSAVLQLAMGFLAVFLVVMVMVQLIVYLSSHALKALKLDVLDRLAGGVLGAAVGVLKVLFVLSITAPLLTKLPMWERSVLAKALLPLAPTAKALLVHTAEDVWHSIDVPND